MAASGKSSRPSRGRRRLRAYWKRSPDCETGRADDGLCGGAPHRRGLPSEGGLDHSKRILIHVEGGKGAKDRSSLDGYVEPFDLNLSASNFRIANLRRESARLS